MNEQMVKATYPHRLEEAVEHLAIVRREGIENGFTTDFIDTFIRNESIKYFERYEKMSLEDLVTILLGKTAKIQQEIEEINR